METINFKASELYLKKVGDTTYLNIRNANDNALVKYAKTIGVEYYDEVEEEITVEETKEEN